MVSRKCVDSAWASVIHNACRWIYNYKKEFNKYSIDQQHIIESVFKGELSPLDGSINELLFPNDARLHPDATKNLGVDKNE